MKVRNFSSSQIDPLCARKIDFRQKLDLGGGNCQVDPKAALWAHLTVFTLTWQFISGHKIALVEKDTRIHVDSSELQFHGRLKHNGLINEKTM